MKEIERIVMDGSSIPPLALTAILMIAIPVAFFICWRVRHRSRTKIGWLAAGMIGFLVSARVLELGVHYLCIIAENPVSRFLNGHTAAFVLYGIAMAGVFEECGRHLILKYVLKKDRTQENAVLYGIGHGGIEILAVVLPAILTELAAAVLFSQGDRESALRTLRITEETAVAALPTVQAAAAFGYASMAMSAVERLASMTAQIGLTVIVYAGVVRAGKACLPAAILLHMLMDLFPALYQRGVLPLWAVEIWAVAWAAVIGLAAAALARRMKALSPQQG